MANGTKQKPKKEMGEYEMSREHHMNLTKQKHADSKNV
jgi:hypothetical protein